MNNSKESVNMVKMVKNKAQLRLWICGLNRIYKISIHRSIHQICDHTHFAHPWKNVMFRTISSLTTAWSFLRRFKLFERNSINIYTPTFRTLCLKSAYCMYIRVLFTDTDFVNRFRGYCIRSFQIIRTRWY